MFFIAFSQLIDQSTVYQWYLSILTFLMIAKTAIGRCNVSINTFSIVDMVVICQLERFCRIVNSHRIRNSTETLVPKSRSFKQLTDVFTVINTEMSHNMNIFGLDILYYRQYTSCLAQPLQNCSIQMYNLLSNSY